MGRETQPLSHFFAKVLQRHREAMNLSRQGLAERAGLHQTAVGLIERGLRTPNVDTLDALAKALQTDAWRLIREAEGEIKKEVSSEKKAIPPPTRKVVRERRVA
nr:helix-turn-helix transcriptional regulator [Nitrosomonas nitrosa]